MGVVLGWICHPRANIPTMSMLLEQPWEVVRAGMITTHGLCTSTIPIVEFWKPRLNEKTGTSPNRSLWQTPMGPERTMVYCSVKFTTEIAEKVLSWSWMLETCRSWPWLGQARDAPWTFMEASFPQSRPSRRETRPTAPGTGHYSSLISPLLSCFQKRDFHDRFRTVINCRNESSPRTSQTNNLFLGRQLGFLRSAIVTRPSRSC
mmetsp:Transcript_8053/g.16996  ORF Transcript_8053/g.16996 Transcript_8053/m.16996 type:complete len:205 (-) Transcript_8053:167-781(-)